jgi:UDP-N-acetylmuramate--alanine ligase
MNFSTGPYFIVGIKGVAMASIAVILKKMGIVVTGSDTADTQPTDSMLKENGINYVIGFSKDDIPCGTRNVIYAASHGGINNPQVEEAKLRGCNIFHQAEFLGELLKNFNISIAVSGCHGKTTTSSLLSYTLDKLGIAASWLIGVPSFNEYWGGRYAGQDYFVIEADEYGIAPPVDKTPKLLSLFPSYSLCLNIDYDHPDVYADLAETKETFMEFFKQTKEKVIICSEDANLVDVVKSFPKDKYLSYGFGLENDLSVFDIKYGQVESSFSINYKGVKYENLVTVIFGEKNILNTAGVILLLFELGFCFENIKQAIRYFTGAKRRFELIANEGDIFVFDDYGHHPHEIEATVQAARSRFKDKRLIIVFQPHTYTRTAQMKKEFAEVLSKADLVLLAPIFGSAREKFQGNVSSFDIQKEAEYLGYKNVQAFDSLVQIESYLKNSMKAHDVIFTMGAGDIYKLGSVIINIIKQ